MRIRTLALGGLALVVLLGVAVLLLLPNWLSRGAPIEAEAPDFTQTSAWIHAPDTVPPAVWENGWAIDFFVLPPVPATLQRHGIVSTLDEPARSAIDRDTAALTALLEPYGTVYMPGLRMPSASAPDPDYSASIDDLSAAFTTYLEEDNRGRAIIPVILPGASDIAPGIKTASAGATERIPLTIVLGNETASGTDLASETLVIETQAGSPLSGLARLPNAPASMVPSDLAKAQSDLSAAIQAAYARLEDVPRRAEPLGGFEVIEVTPIRRPGETDDQD